MDEFILRAAPWVLGAATAVLVLIAAAMVGLMALSFRADLRDEKRDPGQ
jgi:thiol:disulfide interchange protein